MHTETQSYHCLNIALESNYEKLGALLKTHASWTEAWKQEKAQYPHIDIKAEWEKLKAMNIDLVLADAPSYPALLKEIPWHPFGLYIKGILPPHMCIAIVGTRKASLASKAIATKCAEELSRQGVIVVSGLAMGIDEAAHSGSINATTPTVAVLATGLDRVYPAQNSRLADKIISGGGALLSEYPPDSPSYPSRFIHRNRIISGLSVATVVIEAPEKSGSLATARFALEQNREIFVVPGQAHTLQYAGSHKLIRAGARLVTSAQDILEDLNMETSSLPLFTPNVSADSDETEILGIIKEIGWPASIDKISALTKIEVPKINQIITYLTIKGILT